MTQSTNFITKLGPDLTYNGGYGDAFVAKVQANGTGLAYSGFIGGSGDDRAFGTIAVDSDGCLYVTGGTQSTGATFPVIVGPDLTYNGSWDVFLAKVSSGPVAPSNPGSSSIGLSSITWTWQDNASDEDGFKVWADPGAMEPTTLRVTTAADVTSWMYDGLATNTEHAFQVAGTNAIGDSAKTPTLTAWTLIEPVAGLAFSDVTTSSISVTSTNTPSNLSSGDSGLLVSNATTGTDSGWQQHTTPWLSSGLTPNTEYHFSGQSRNGAGLTTAAATGAMHTLAATPLAPVVNNPTGTTLDTAIGTGDGNPPYTEYALYCATAGLWVRADGTLGASSVWQTAAAWGTVTVTGLAEYVEHAFTVTARNGAGVETLPGPSGAAWTLDVTPPTGAVFINGGAAYATTTAVMLSLSASDAGSGVADTRLSHNGADWSGWEPFAASRAWTLEPGDGLKTVHVQYRDHGNNVSSAPIMDSITLDGTPPNAPVVSGPVLTNAPRPTWTWNSGGGGNGVYQYELDASGLWVETTATAFTPDTDLVEGDHTLRVRERDDAGNWSVVGSHTLTLSAATLGAALHRSGPAETGADSVSFAVTFSRAVSPSFDAAAVSVTGALTGAVAVSGADPAYTVTVTLADPDADGTVGIAVTGGVVQDAFGNVYAGGASPLYQIWNWHEPWFTVEPAGARSYVGDEHTLSATANCGASTLTYQWKWDDGAKTEHLGPATQNWALAGLSLDHAGAYWCEAHYDGATRTTAPATLEVAPPLTITQQPQGGQKDIGDNHEFTVIVTGGYMPLTYQWRKNEAVILDAPDDSIYALTGLEGTDSGRYTVVVTDNNSASVESAPAVLLVGAGLPISGVHALLALIVALAIANLVLIHLSHRREEFRRKKNN